MSEEEFANYFSQFGHVLDATLMLDRATGRPRGFGFITFESDRGVDAALSRPDLMLHDKKVRNFFFIKKKERSTEMWNLNT